MHDDRLKKQMEQNQRGANRENRILHHFERVHQPTASVIRARSSANLDASKPIRDMMKQIDQIAKLHMPHPQAIKAAQQQHDQFMKYVRKTGLPVKQIENLVQRTTQLQESIPHFDELVRMQNREFQQAQTVSRAADLFDANPGLVSLALRLPLTDQAQKKVTEQFRKQHPDGYLVVDDIPSQGWTGLSIEKNGQREIVQASVPQLGLSAFLPNLNEFELGNFINELILHPHFAFENPNGLGWKIYRALADLSTSSQIVPIQQDVYRARKFKKGQNRGFTIRDMYGPPYDLAGQARFNSPGDSVLYVCSNPVGTIREIRSIQEDEGSIYKFELDVKLKILDMTEDEHLLFDFCLRPVEDPSKYQSTRNEYALSNFVAGCCKKLGIEGIKYRSTLHNDSINYVFFDLPVSRLNRPQSGAFKYVEGDWRVQFS